MRYLSVPIICVALCAAWFFSAVAAADTPIPRTLIVALDGSGQYRSIQEAVDAAGKGDTVEVRAGEYYEDVTIHSKQGLRLIGEGVDRVKIMGRSRVGSFHIGKWPYGATDILVTGMTVNSHGGLALGIFNGRALVLQGLRINGLLFSQQADDVRVENCVVGDSETTGMAFADSRAVLTGNFVHDNDHGVTVAGKSSVRLERNIIVRNLFDGVVVSDQAQAVLKNNTIVRNAGGVAFVGTGEGTAEGNIVAFNRIGFLVEPRSRATLSFNLLYNTEQDYSRSADLTMPVADVPHESDLRADPLFVDPDGDDYRLREQSPAMRVGSLPYLGALPITRTP